MQTGLSMASPGDSFQVGVAFGRTGHPAAGHPLEARRRAIGSRWDSDGAREGQQGANHQQAPVQPHVDASDAAKAQVLVHVVSSVSA